MRNFLLGLAVMAILSNVAIIMMIMAAPAGFLCP